MSTYLRRYTNLPALIHLLSEQRITLLDPESWDDSNDSHYLSLYREKKKLKTVLAICFTQTAETYQHWRVFADGPSGVCVRFKKSRLVKSLGQWPGLRSGPIEYLTLSDIKNRKLSTEELPFLKRYAFNNEKEFRVIYESQRERRQTYGVAFPLSCIDSITLSPWMPHALYQHVKQTILSIDRCGNLDVARSTLINNEEWKRRGESATNQSNPPISTLTKEGPSLK